jgi:hypothetical protein
MDLFHEAHRFNQDVVPTWKEVGTTNYLVPKAEAQEMIKECLASGIGIVIERRR